jgi:hypothetical protein
MVIMVIVNNSLKLGGAVALRGGLRFVCCAILITGIFLTVPTQAEGTTINAQSASLADVTSAIGSASDGDTVVVPAGTASWTSGLTITKGITLLGANANPGDDLTVILDDVTRDAPSQGTAIKVKVSAGQSFRLSGITFRNGSITSPEGPNGIVTAATITGPCRSFRIDHCHFDQLYQSNYLQVAGWIYGVVDHCLFDGRIDGADQSVLVMHPTWGGGTNQFGDGSWADYPYYGTEKFIFIEDNIFNNPNPNNHTNMNNDCSGGGRYVGRHNVYNNCMFGGGHGTESSGRLRSRRCSEDYNNIVNDTHAADNGGQLRGGGSLYHDNVVNGLYIPIKSITQYREFWPFPTWGATAGTSGSPSLAADGTSPWDLNDTEGNGTNVPGHPPYLYVSGTHNGSNGSAVLVDTTKNWTTNQWVGYSITNTTQLVTLAQGFGRYGSFIESNTANTITFHTDGTYGLAMFFNAGDGYAIHQILRSLDQGGAGKGDVVAGATPINTAMGNTVAWPRQALEPIYYWNNTGTSGMTIGSSFPTFQENRDYFNLGNGFPANSTPSAVSAEFVAALNGVDYTGPYIYPHPLVNGVPPGAPQNLRVIP